MSQTFDIAICGAGPIGLALAASLIKHGTLPSRIALIDAKTIEQSSQDPRSIALSYGSRQLLEALNAWPNCTTEIHQIHVSRRGHFGRTLIDRTDHEVPALGYVTRYGALVKSLVNSLEATAIVAFRPLQLTAISERDDHVELSLSDGRTVTTAILVQAEGGVFSEQSAKTLRRDYHQTAMVAHVRSSTPPFHRAFERFTNEGPLALLPQDDGYAMVWCGKPDTIEQLATLDDAAFLATLQQTFGLRAGRFISISKRNNYPLGLNAQPAATARTVAIGNAAQTLHPVAGQGLNLGLRDSAVLARQLSQHAMPDGLRKFTQLRQSDRNRTIRLTDTMARIFSSTAEHALSQSLLGISLGTLDVLKPAKYLLAEQMIFGQR